MRLLVRCGGRTLSLAPSDDATAGDLSALVEASLGYASADGTRLRLLYAGRQLDPRGAIAAALRPRCELHAVGRVRGGGGDGGVYPLTHAEQKWMTPSEMGLSGKAWTKQWADKATEETKRLDRVTLCSASSQPLRPPIVVTDLGYLCNKDALIEALLSKTLPAHLAHVKSLRDVGEAKLTPNPHARPDADFKAGADTAEVEVPFCCPVADLPFNGRHPFVWIRPSGHVVSERAYRQMGGARCPVTEVPCVEDDAVPLNGTEEQREQLAERAAARKAAQKEQKRKAKSAAAAASAATPSAEAATAGAPDVGTKGSVNASSAVATATAAAASPGVRRPTKGGAGRQRPSVSAKEGKRVREWEKAVADKAAGSEVYKSLFVTKEQREREVEQSNDNFCARGIPMSLTRTTKFTM